MTSIQNCFAFTLSVVCLVVVGCQHDDLADVDLPIPEASNSASDSLPETSTVTVNNPGDVDSPAATADQLPNAEAAPEVICKKFLEYLNQENADRFELLLTPAAMAVSSRVKFHLPPVADIAATVKLEAPKYSTNREKLCYIDSILTEGEGASMMKSKITWMLRKTKAGWRVAGMLVDEGEDRATNLLSFESIADVRQIKDSLTVDVSVTQLER